MKEMKEMCWPSGDTNGLAPRVSQADAYLVISALGTGGKVLSLHWNHRRLAKGLARRLGFQRPDNRLLPEHR